MTSRLIELGQIITPVSVRNSDLRIKTTLGVNLQKEFIQSIANLDTVDLSNYKIVKRGQFGCKLMSVGRDGRLPISLLTEYDEAVISPAYHVFKVDESRCLPEYLMLVFLKHEFERELWFKGDADVRAGVSWDYFCETKIPLPDLETQKKYVGVYSNLLKLSSNHEKSFTDLQLITDTFTEKLVEKYGTESLGGYIQTTDTRNSSDTLGAKDLRGISTSKAFIQSKANTTGVSFTNYKVVQPGQFAYVADTSRRGDKIALAYNDGKPYIISSIYTTFEITDVENLLPEFLLLWFKRPEFDRYARYNSWGSARETFDWSEMQRVQLPVPPITVQKSIVAIYHALEARKRLTERLKTTIKEISPILIKDARDKVGAAA